MIHHLLMVYHLKFKIINKLMNNNNNNKIYNIMIRLLFKNKKYLKINNNK